MKFINTIGNTIRLVDIDRYVPFIGDNAQTLEPEMVKKSYAFQSLVLDEKFVIVEASDDRLEQNLLRTVKKDTYEIEDRCTIPEVLVRGSFHNNTGYAKANRNLVNGMLAHQVNVIIEPLEQNASGLNEMELNYLSSLMRPSSNRGILIHSSIPSFADKTDFKYNILNTTVESRTVPQQFIEACNLYDEVWVVSDFCKDVLEKHGVRRHIEVIPNSIDHRFYSHRARPANIVPNLKTFSFISVFGWNWRKGYDALLKAYLQNFTSDDDVSLLLVTPYEYANGQRIYSIEDEINEFIDKYGGTNPPHIVRCGRVITEFEMQRLYRACQCFVMPSRGEGFGLPYMEASLCGLPVIATRYSGQLMFLQDSNSYLLDVDTISAKGSEKTHIHFWEGQEFPELTSDKVINQLGGLMQEVINNYQVAKNKNRILQLDILNNYTCEVVGNKARKRLEAIWKSL